MSGLADLLPEWVDTDPEYGAALWLLTHKYLEEKTAPYVTVSSDGRVEIDWNVLELPGWSSGELLVLQAAYALFAGGECRLHRLVRTLDDDYLLCVLRAIGIRRGWTNFGLEVEAREAVPA